MDVVKDVIFRGHLYYNPLVSFGMVLRAILNVNGLKHVFSYGWMLAHFPYNNNGCLLATSEI